MHEQLLDSLVRFFSVPIQNISVSGLIFCLRYEGSGRVHRGHLFRKGPYRFSPPWMCSRCCSLRACATIVVVVVVIVFMLVVDGLMGGGHLSVAS